MTRRILTGLIASLGVLAVAWLAISDPAGEPYATRSTTTTETPVVVPATAAPAVTATSSTTTTTEPVVVPVTATPATTGCGEWRDLVASYFPADQINTACRVLMCESHGNPHAVSHTNDHGLWQLNAPSWRTTFPSVVGVSWEAGVYDPVLNTEFAAWLYHQSGWSPWVCAR